MRTPQAWERIKAWLLERGFVQDTEESLIPLWQACIDSASLTGCPRSRPRCTSSPTRGRPGPPQHGEEIARLVAGAEVHLFKGMGHSSLRGHTHDVFNPIIKDIVERYR